jgi:hypothetical protein
MLVSAAAAAVVALSLFDATPADAASKGRSVTTRSVQRAPSRSVQTRTHKSVGSANKVSKGTSNFVKKNTSTNFVKKGTKGTASTFVGKSKIGTGALNLRSLPLHKAAAGNALLKGRVGVPQNIRPKLTLTHAPGLKFRPRFSPFVQRHWKKAFFWVAVAGIGYLTIPELYYNSFYSCVSVDDPVWDDCSYILSYAAIEEDEVVRVSMPATAKYRYTAKAPAPPSDCPSCRWDRFVERKWNQSFAWVKLPQVGNITVPDAYYDRFYTYAGANPPNYPQACQVLTDAAAVTEEKDAVRISKPADTDYRYVAEVVPAQECKSCTLQPFVERKWNKEYVWVQVPQAGNVTVPEDSYDRFYGYASAEPPNYPAACKVLVEAAAADTVMTTALDTRRDDQ